MPSKSESIASRKGGGVCPKLPSKGERRRTRANADLDEQCPPRAAPHQHLTSAEVGRSDVHHRQPKNRAGTSPCAGHATGRLTQDSARRIADHCSIYPL